MQMHNPAHPGKLLAEFMGERSVTEVAKHLGVTRAALSRVLNSKAGVSAEMALKLSEAFGLDAEVWLRMQVQRDLWVASRKKRVKVRRLVLETAT
ncbi:HigA family addiction module antitoxin [Granulicella sp. dw_53]|uniref:HigA family addiction module antitoxin n=1 Tax=Granulicella sp. dw_53 TaxID=2719792 RepID=UPI001BD3447B|nr:HigA family addiction module antitoxin [Granulicella sp. dw_53]